MRAGNDFRWNLLLCIAGFTSGAFLFGIGFVFPTISPDHLFRKLIDHFDVGAIFGLFVGTCLIRGASNHRILRLILLTLASSAAYLVAVLAAVWTIPYFHSKTQQIETPLPVFFVAGFVGAFILLFAVLGLFHRGPVNPKSLVVVLAWSVVGGILGVVGWGAGSGHQDNTRFVTLYFIWQTGMAACISFMQPRASATSEMSEESRPAREIESGAFNGTLRIITALFFFGVLCFLGWQYSRVVRGHDAFKQRQKAYQAYLAEVPPYENLPSISSLPLGEALLLQNIGRFVASNPSMRRSSGSGTVPKNVVATAPSISYSVFYKVSDGPLATGASPQMATVLQYPNQEWAHFVATRFNPVTYSPGTVGTESHFGNQVTLDRLISDNLRVVWPSGSFVISISYRGPESDPLLKAYLEKYPSSF